MSILPLSVRLSVLISLLIIVFPSSASVVMTNTRVIYPSDAKERSVQLRNNDNFPNVVQVWTDINNSESTPENADGPFLALPAIFRIEPNRGQLFRLIYSGDNLPKDRESLFYLNFLQIPPISKDNAGENQMLVMLKNRVKIFYRPIEIKSNPESIGREISFNVKQINGGVEVDINNKSPFYASFVDVKLISGNQELKIPVDMVEPKGNKLVKVHNQQFVSIHPMKVKFTIVNDFGGFIKYEYEIK
ncbi:molecular chaperone [Shewanella xiamenensis]|uniref:fimbrial biogenesis chaperone n=1 Tax=Shewanella xiamenensis TaxID=332186 RepID=UPI00313C14F4